MAGYIRQQGSYRIAFCCGVSVQHNATERNCVQWVGAGAYSTVTHLEKPATVRLTPKTAKNSFVAELEVEYSPPAFFFSTIPITADANNPREDSSIPVVVHELQVSEASDSISSAQ
jgi:hypothetical protein